MRFIFIMFTLFMKESSLFIFYILHVENVFILEAEEVSVTFKLLYFIVVLKSSRYSSISDVFRKSRCKMYCSIVTDPPPPVSRDGFQNQVESALGNGGNKKIHFIQ